MQCPSQQSPWDHFKDEFGEKLIEEEASWTNCYIYDRRAYAIQHTY
jgi:hypothetical protein